MIDRINQRLPETVVLVAQITGVNANQQYINNVAAYNEFIPKIVQQRADAHYKVKTVDMQLVTVSSDMNLAISDRSDLRS